MTAKVVKICKHHGELTKKQTYARSDGNAIRCAICVADKGKRYRLNNHDMVRAKRNIWQRTKKSKEYQKEQRAKARKNLKNSYIKNLLTKRTELKALNIPKSLIDAKRLSVKIKRLLDERRNSNEN